MHRRLGTQPEAKRLASDIDELQALRRMAVYLSDQLATMSDKSAYVANLLVESISSDINEATSVPSQSLN